MTNPAPAHVTAVHSWQDHQVGELSGRSPCEVAATLATDPRQGLSATEAATRLAICGPNDPAPLRPRGWPVILLRQFASALIFLLLPATIVSLLLREWLNAAAIGVTVVVSAGFGFVNEYRSEQAITALRRLAARRAEVVRDGLHEDIPATDLAPGDLIVVADGDVIPADARVIEARGLLVNESILTGEPVAMPKDPAPVFGVSDGTAPSVLLAGTTVAAGSGTAIVVVTGAGTTLGDIFSASQSTGRQVTPMEARLEQLGRRLIMVFLLLCALLVGVGVAQGRDPRDVVEMAVSLAIGAVPEGLPAVATTALAVAVRRLAARHVVVRRLDAVETLGSTTVIVTDKTGTLTENRMTVRRVLLADGTVVEVGVHTDGDVPRTTIDATERGTRAAAERVLQVAALCNDAIAEYDAAEGWHAHGDPSEGAIVLAAAGLGHDGARRHAEYPRLSTEPFTTARRLMRTVHQAPDAGELIAVKGAFDQVGALTSRDIPALRAATHALGDAGYRVFTVAEGPDADAIRVIGAVVLEDPLRPDAAAAVAASQAAGIRVMLVTGDQLATATNIARQTGILTGDQLAVRGPDLDLASLDRVAVVARATHAQKEAIVAALQGRGEIVAMTGDGVNDAPALRAAHVGVAIGPNATDVAVEAAHILVADGRLGSLVHGIREGRAIARNLREAIVYLLTASFGTIMVIALAMVTSDALPLAPLQILWLNLVVHIFPALALATSREPGDGESLSRPTRALLTDGAWLEIAWRAATVTIATRVALFAGERTDASLAQIQTMVFIALTAGLVGQAFLIGVYDTRAQIARLRRAPLWVAGAISGVLTLGALYLPLLRDALALEGPRTGEWVIALGCTAGSWAAGQVVVVLAGRWSRTRRGPLGVEATRPRS